MKIVVLQRSYLHLMAGPPSGLHISLGHVTRLDQCIDTSPGQLGAIPTKAIVQKWASDPIIAAKIMIVPAAIL